MHQGGTPKIGCNVAANTRLVAAIEVKPEQVTVKPTT